jgi:competence protein ComEC
LWDEVWKITCVSIAAQVTTFPLGLFYFHQFPNYFLLSNLFVIPLSFVVLIVGVAVLAFYFLQPVAVLLGSLLEGLIKIMNNIVFGVDSLPFSHLENVHITTLQCWLLMGMIVMLILLIKRKRIAYLYAAACLTLCFSGAGWWHFREAVNVPRLTVYKVKGHTALDMTFRGQAFFLADTVLKKDPARLKRYLQPGRTETGVRTVRYIEEQPFTETVEGGRIIVWRGQSFLQITHKNFSVPEKIKVDYLIISNNAVTDLERFTDHVKAKEIILDSSNTYYIVNKLLKSPQASRLKIHSVLHQGALTKLINL